MNGVVLQHVSDSLPEIRLSGDEPWNDPYSLSPNTDIDDMLDPTYNPYAVDTAELTHGVDLTRSAHMEMRLSHLEKSASGFPSYPAINKNQHGTAYYVGEIPYLDDGEVHLSPTVGMRYASPSGSCGGDRSATDVDSSMSEHSWGSPIVPNQSDYPNSQSCFSPPMSDTFQYYPDPSAPQLSGNLEGSYCGSEYSVTPRDLQRYPDPAPDKNSNYGDDKPGMAFDIPAYHQQLEMSREGPVELPLEGHIPLIYQADVSGPPVKAEWCDEHTKLDDLQHPRKRMRYCSTSEKKSAPAPTSDPSSTSVSANNKSQSKTTSRPQLTRSGKRGSRRKPAPLSRKSIASRGRTSRSGCVFVCPFAPYGCTTNFTSKNEWKRHVACQHLQLGFYRCDVGFCNVDHPAAYPPTSSPAAAQNFPFTPRSPNDFNRKDLFTQHQRRMHVPWSTQPNSAPPSKAERDIFEESLEEVRSRCWVQRREAPQRSVCSFCACEFSGPQCWDDRMEHVGKHYQMGDQETGEDVALREWALKEGVITESGKGRWILSSLQEHGGRARHA